MLGPHALGRAVVQGVVRNLLSAPSPKLVEPGMTSPEMGLRHGVGVLFDKAVDDVSGATNNKASNALSTWPDARQLTSPAKALHALLRT